MYSENSHQELIPVTWIKQFHYCPRIIYFIAVLGVEERTTESMIEGRETHRVEELKELRRKTLGGARKVKVKKRWLKLKVTSERLGLIGVVDQIVDLNGELAVVEVKRGVSPRKPLKHHIYQTVAYAMLAEEVLNRPVRKIVIRYLPEDTSFTIPVTDSMRKHIEWTVKRIRRILKDEKPPTPHPSRRCHSCGWLWICRKV